MSSSPKPSPDFSWEQKLGKKIIAGIDEVGRGALAGPVVAAAVILPTLADAAVWQEIGIQDSKKLSEKKRLVISDLLHARADVFIGIGAGSPTEIDQLGIVPANYLAMTRAVAALKQKPQALLVDGTKVPPALAKDFPSQAIVRGDSASLSIAAASIVAKVWRDGHMRQLARDFPAFSWHSNVGYGAKAHLRAIAELGATPHHRMTFAPLKNL